MKKEIVIGIVAVLICSSLGTVGQAAISIENSIEISGIGIIDHCIEAQTNFTMTGQKYTESVITPSLGWYGISNVNIHSEFGMLTGNESDIAIEGTTISNYTAAMYSMRNYDLGAVQEFLYRGDTTISYELMADNFSSLMITEGTTEGKMEYNIVLKNSNTRKTLYNEKFEFLGLLNYIGESYIENVTYPGAGDEDWLGCP